MEAEATLSEIFDELVRAGDIEQVRRCSAPVPEVVLVPTLSVGVYARASPQLLERFRYAESWVGPCGLEFLPVHELTRVWDKRDRIYAAVEGRRQVWENALMNAVPPEQVSLIAISGPHRANEVYLIWRGNTEPEVVSYVVNVEDHDHDLKDFFLGWL